VNPPAAKPAAATAGGSSLVVEATDATFTSILELSNSVPVLVEFYGQGLEPSLGSLVAEFGGRMVLATIDGTKNPQLVQAFQVTEVPTVAAVIAGRPLQLFVGLPSPEEIRAVLDQVLEVAKQQNVTGTVPVADGDADAAEAEPVEEPLPPHHQEAYDAIAAGDYATAIAEYQLAITQNPRDALAVAGLAQVSLLARLDGKTADGIRSAAAAAPADVDAQLAVADLDISGGHAEDAFLRLLELFPTLDADGKNAVRTRLLEHFEVVGIEDPRVIAARRRLTALLY
jgi:putative thioredoxin